MVLAQHFFQIALPKPFCWAKPACFDFTWFNFTLEGHILIPPGGVALSYNIIIINTAWKFAYDCKRSLCSRERETPPIFPTKLFKFCSSGVIKNCQLPLMDFMARTLAPSALASHMIQKCELDDDDGWRKSSTHHNHSICLKCAKQEHKPVLACSLSCSLWQKFVYHFSFVSHTLILIVYCVCVCKCQGLRMKTGKLAVIVLLLSSCLLASGNVYINNNSGSTVKVSVKESAGIPKQTVSMNGGSDHNFTVGAGKMGAFKFVHISTLTVATLVYVHTGNCKS